jgi:sulfate permease, SulP family
MIAARVRELLPPRSDWEAVKRAPLGDLVAGSTVALVALPLALAFGVSSGLGAEAGLVTAIVAGAVAAIFGGSSLQVSGPTGAMAVVVVPVAQQYGSRGVLMVGAMAGIVLIGLAFAKVGRYAKYLPLPVIEGFTAGIAIVIALQQFPAALGTSGSPAEKVWQNAFHAARHFVTHPAPAALLLALAVAALILAGSRKGPRLPVSLLVVAAATLFVHAAGLDLTTLGHLPRTLPGPSLSFVHPGAFGALFPAALAVAALAALESLLSASVADGMTVNERHDPNRELFGQGLANLAAAMFGGVPATGAIARTAVNVRAGASSKLASLFHAFVLGAVVFAAAPLVADIPVAALAGVLFATTVRMIQAASLLPVIRATRADAAVLLLTLGVTVVFNLITAIAVGVGVAVVLALRTVAQSVRMDEVPLEGGDHSDEERALLAEHIVAYRFDGPLLFAAAQRFLLRLTETADVKVVIVRMSRVTALDATGAHVLGEAIKHLERRGIVVLLSGIQTTHQGVIDALGVAGHMRGEGLLFPDTPSAIAYARKLVHRDASAGRVATTELVLSSK